MFKIISKSSSRSTASSSSRSVHSSSSKDRIVTQSADPYGPWALLHMVPTIGSDSLPVIDQSIPCAQPATDLTQPQANEEDRSDPTEDANFVRGAIISTQALVKTQSLQGSSSCSTQRRILDRIASVEARLEAIRHMLGPSDANDRLRALVKSMLEEELRILGNASQEHASEHASQFSRLHESQISTQSGQPGNIQPPSINALAAATQEPEVLSEAVASALRQVDQLDSDIDGYMHPMQSPQKPEDLYSAQTLISRYGNPVILGGEEFYRLPDNIFEGYTLRLPYFASISGKIASYATKNWHNRLLTEADYQFLKGFRDGTYTRINLMVFGDGSARIKRGLHSTIGLMFLVRPEGPDWEVHHRRDNTSNNRVTNLQWLPHRTNVTYACGKSVKSIEVATGVEAIFQSKTKCYEHYKLDKQRLNEFIKNGREWHGYTFHML